MILRCLLANLRTGRGPRFVGAVFAVAVIVVDLADGNNARPVEASESLEVGIVKGTLHERDAARHEGQVVGAHGRVSGKEQ